MSLFKAKNTTSRSERISAFDATTCEFGTAVPYLYGTSKMPPNVINYQDFTSKEHKTTTKSGKSKHTQITYRYYVYTELGIGEGPIEGIGRVWVGDKGYNSLAALNDISSNEGSPLAVNLGNNNKPTAYMISHHASIAQAYPNLVFAYGFIYLGEDNASMPSYSFETLGQLRKVYADGVDANPACIIQDILERLNLGAFIDDLSFSNYRNYCVQADILVSTPKDYFSEQMSAQQLIADLLELTNTYMFWSLNCFKFVPRDDRAWGNWEPNVTIMYDLTKDDLAPSSNGIVKFKRKDSSEVYNYVSVSFTNRANEYESETVAYQDVQDVENRGIISAEFSAPWLHTKERAIKYAQSKARMALTEMNQYTFELDWAYCRLEVGDLVTLTDETIGLVKQPVMIKEIEESADGILTVTAIQRGPADYTAPMYMVEDNYNFITHNVLPGDTAEPLFITPPKELLTSNGLEVWIALHGKDITWGGCQVYLSDKDSNYTFNGCQDSSSMFGITTSYIGAEDTEVTVKFSNPTTVEMVTGSVQDAEDANTLVWIDGECLAYSLATLVDKNTFKLTGLKRGLYSTKARSHEDGSKFAVLDDSIYVVPFTKNYNGRLMYFKFPSFNVLKGNVQDVGVVDYYTKIVNPYDVSNVENLFAYATGYLTSPVDVQYDIEVSWLPPDDDNYSHGMVYYRNKLNDSTADDEWVFAGTGQSTYSIKGVESGTTYEIAVVSVDIYGVYESPDESEQVECFVSAIDMPDRGDDIDDLFKEIPYYEDGDNYLY